MNFCILDENFFDTSDVATPAYDNGVPHDFDSNLSPEEREAKRQEYQQELAKVKITHLKEGNQ